MADLLPIFPLPNVVLFPNVFLPLHIFEPRYREMVGDAICGDRLIGMVLLRPGWEQDYEGRPAVYPIGTTGLITHVERLDDGRYSVVLRGIERFRIVEENQERSYRRATVEPFADGTLAGEDRQTIRLYRSRLEGLLAMVVERELRRTSGDQAGAKAAGRPVQSIDPKIPSGMADEDLVNALAQYLDFEPLEKQALLEQYNLRARAESLVELLRSEEHTSELQSHSFISYAVF